MLPARRYPNILCLTANEKDFSLSLEMTIWEKRYSPPFLWKEGVSTLAPSLGRGCRAQRGGVGFLFCGEAASSLPSPRGEGFVHRYCFPHISYIRSDDMGIAVSPFRSLPPRNSISIRAIKPPCGATYIAPQGGLYISTGAIPCHPAGGKGDPC